MKKLFLILSVSLLTLTVSAQDVARPWKIGGSLGLGWVENVGVDFTLSPEVTYQFNDNWGVGGSVGINVAGGSQYYQTTYAILVSPYARYTPLHVGIFSLFLDMGFTLGGANDIFVANVGVSPGLSFDFTDNFTLIANCGFVGYQYGITTMFPVSQNAGMSAVGIDLSSTNLSIGAFFRF